MGHRITVLLVIHEDFECKPHAAGLELNSLARCDLVFEVQGTQVLKGYVEWLRGIVCDTAGRHDGRSKLKMGSWRSLKLIKWVYIMEDS